MTSTVTPFSQCIKDGEAGRIHGKAHEWIIRFVAVVSWPTGRAASKPLVWFDTRLIGKRWTVRSPKISG